MDDSVFTYDEIIDVNVKSYDEETKTISKVFNEKKVACKTQHFYILLIFLLTTIILLMAVSTYCYLIKYQAKQNILLPFHITNNNFFFKKNE